MDKGYVSRVLSKFEKNGLLTRQTVSGAKGQKRIILTDAGREESERIDRGGDRQIEDKLGVSTRIRSVSSAEPWNL